jgi:tRNA A37 threonylcarbamoyladenosine modification protein TsaB
LLSALEFNDKNRIKMTKLIIDAANEKIFLMLINKDNIYSITHENTKINYEKLILLIEGFISSKKINYNDLSEIYINRGPGSFAGIRNSLSIVKAIFLAKKIDYYCYSLQDFEASENTKYENIPNLCDKYQIKKNLINPIY